MLSSGGLASLFRRLCELVGSRPLPSLYKACRLLETIRAGTSLGPPLFIQGHEALNPQTAHAMILAAKPGSGFAKRTTRLDSRVTRRGVAASSCPAKKGRITRAGVPRMGLPSPLSRDHRANRPGCQDLSPTKKEGGASCRPPCLLFSWQCIEGPKSASLYEWFASRDDLFRLSLWEIFPDMLAVMPKLVARA
jgi:hypothetical protein